MNWIELAAKIWVVGKAIQVAFILFAVAIGLLIAITERSGKANRP